MPDRHLTLLHHLEQRGLDLRRRAVDLVREEEVAEDRSELGVELTFAGSIDPCADEIGGHEVRRELNARERAAEDACGRLDRQRLREARDAFDEEMALGKQADEHALEHVVLPRDDPPDLEQGLLQALLRLCRRRRGQVGARLGHIVSLRRWHRVIYESRRT